eukprot:sb/3471576/
MKQFHGNSILHKALKAGKPVRAANSVSLADGLAVPTVGLNAFVTAQPLVDKIITVSEKAIALSILRLVEIEKNVVEGSGVVGLAALIDGQLPELKGKRVCTILCGGNIDTTVLGRCLERGLAADHRLLSFTVVVKDAPGGMKMLTERLAESGARTLPPGPGESTPYSTTLANRPLTQQPWT